MADASRAQPEGQGTVAERLVCAYLAALPLLWAIGLILPMAVLTSLGVCTRYVRSRRALSLAWPWFLIGVCQLASAGVNLVDRGESLWRLPRHLLASYVIGWFVLAACIAIGASGLLRPAPLLRATARIGMYCIALAIVLYPLALVGGGHFMHVLTPVGRLLPVSLPSTSFFFGMLLYNWEDLFGVSLPRLSLLFPWTTAMGFGGNCLLLVALNEPDRRRRRRAVASGAFMVLASMSRLAILVMLICVTLRLLLGCGRRVQIALASFALALALFTAIGSTLWWGTPTGFVDAAAHAFGSIRPSASRSRDLVYEASWRGFYEKPVIGHGWPGEPVYPEDFPQVMEGGGTMVPGSHSTFLGLLYLGGIVTFAAFLFALTRTLLLMLTVDGPPALVRNTLVLLVAVALTGIGEGVYTLVVPTLFAFLWLGVALRDCRPRRSESPLRATDAPAAALGWAV